MTKYIKSLKVALNQPAIEKCSMTEADIRAIIEDIGKQLKGCLSNEERLLLVADRSELRATLASLKQD